MTQRKNKIDPYRLSHSTLDTLHACEKLFQLSRMSDLEEVREMSPAAIRGTAFGAGVQEYLLSGDMNKALITCWLEYWPNEEDRPTVSCWRTLNNLILCQNALDEIRYTYEVAVFNSKPAIELSFRLNRQDSKYYYVGFVDIVLIHKTTGVYYILEIKTTGYKISDLRPVYQNSGQGLSYSIVLDKIAGEAQSHYGVLYLVVREKYKDPIPDVYLFDFKKTLVDRLKWFSTLAMDMNHLDQMEALSFYPTRGHSCIRFNRPCYYFNNCQLESLTQQKRPVPEEVEEYDFVYDVDELVDDHLQRVQKGA